MKRAFIIFLHAFIGWAMCGATIGITFSFTTESNALIIHAIAVPFILGIISWNYFHKYHYTSALMTAFIFLVTIMFLDFFVVALIIQKSFAMFGSLAGTWIPFILIFCTTYIIGILVKKRAA